MAYSLPQDLGNSAGKHAAAVQVPPGHSIRALVTVLGKAKALWRVKAGLAKCPVMLCSDSYKLRFVWSKRREVRAQAEPL